MTDHPKHYPNFDVMREQQHWDPHTRKIVTDRLNEETLHPYCFLTEEEGENLSRMCSLLLDDERSSVLSFVVHHFDSTLNADLGESQRKIGMPKQTIVIRDGLAWLDETCSKQYGSNFVAMASRDQREIVGQILQGYSQFPSNGGIVPAKDWLDMIFAEAVSAYYSHPSVWTEIGYAGPAYPRGYVRSELGLTDPWEAKRDGR